MSRINSRAAGDPDAFEYAVMTDPFSDPDPNERGQYWPSANTDPNFQSHDGLQSVSYAGGDFIYVRTTNGQVELQGRQFAHTFGQIEQIAIRDHQDIVQFSLLSNALSAGEIRVNRQTVTLTDAKPWYYFPTSGMTVVRHIPETGDTLSIADAYTVITSTGDHFEVGTRHATLTLTTAIASRGQVEGILGNADGNRLNDFKPRGNATPLPIQTNFPYTGQNHYSKADYEAFVDSWKVTGSTESLFDSPFIPIGPGIDAWSNTLSQPVLRQGFDLFRQYFGVNSDPYLAWRFATDVAAQFRPEDLRGIYQRLITAGVQAPPPPRDADINLNGIPDVQEPSRWNFDALLGIIRDANTCQQQGGYFNTTLGQCFLGYTLCQAQGGTFNTTTGVCTIPDAVQCQQQGGFYNIQQQRCYPGYATCIQQGGSFNTSTGVCTSACTTANYNIGTITDITLPSNTAVPPSSGGSPNQPSPIFRVPWIAITQDGTLEQLGPTFSTCGNVNLLTKQILATGLGSTWGITAYQNDYLITRRDNGGQLIRVTPSGSVTVVASGLGDPHGVAVNGTLAVVATNEGIIKQINLTNGTTTNLATESYPFWDVDFAPAVQLIPAGYYATSDKFGGSVLRILPTGQVDQVLDDTGSPNFRSFNRATNSLVAKPLLVPRGISYYPTFGYNGPTIGLAVGDTGNNRLVLLDFTTNNSLRGYSSQCNYITGQGYPGNFQSNLNIPNAPFTAIKTIGGGYVEDFNFYMAFSPVYSSLQFGANLPSCGSQLGGNEFKP